MQPVNLIVIACWKKNCSHALGQSARRELEMQARDWFARKGKILPYVEARRAHCPTNTARCAPPAWCVCNAGTEAAQRRSGCPRACSHLLGSYTCCSRSAPIAAPAAARQSACVTLWLSTLPGVVWAEQCSGFGQSVSRRAAGSIAATRTAPMKLTRAAARLWCALRAACVAVASRSCWTWIPATLPRMGAPATPHLLLDSYVTPSFHAGWRAQRVRVGRTQPCPGAPPWNYARCECRMLHSYALARDE